MTCPTDEVLAAWSAGVLVGPERDDVEGHAAGCPTCRALAIALAGVRPRDAATRLGAEGATIDRYRIVGSLGQGAMGVVLRGHDPVLDREVAIKMLASPGTSDAQRERMLREAQTLARLDHPNVVRVFDAGVVADEVFVAMEYVVGSTLSRWLSETAPSPDERIAVLADAGRGIAAVHAAGLVHRDIKPDNILVRMRGDVAQATLIDFGLARAPRAENAGPAGSGIAGTPHYLAPELRSGAVATAASDQFAWWTVVAETLRDSATPAIERAIARGTSDDPAARFSTMDAAIAALLPPQRRAWLWVVAGGVAAAAGAAAIATVAAREPAPDPCAVAPPARWVAERATIAERLRAVGVDSATVVAAIDHRAWLTTALRGEACRDAGASTNDTRTRALRQQLCVDESWQETERLFPGLLETSANIVRTAVDDLVLVIPAERCGSGTIPSVPAPPPGDKLPEARAIEQAFRDIQFGSEDPHARIPKLRALEPRLRALAYPPLDAKYHADLGGQLAALGDHAGAKQELDLSIQIAESCGDDDARTRGLINLLHLAMQTGQTDTAAIERTAEAAVARVGNPGITAELYASQAMLRYARNDLVDALAKMRASQQELASIAIEAHGRLVTTAQNLASLEQVSGDLAAAQATYDRGYQLARRRYGDDAADTLEIRGARATNLLYGGHPDLARPELALVAAGLERQLGAGAARVVQARSYLCEADLALHAADTATTCDAALASAERTFGATHPQIIWQLMLAGQTRLAAHPADALPLFERALALAEKAAVTPNDLPLAQGYVALALHALHRDTPRAHQLARDALRVIESMPDKREMVADLRAAFP